jgi:hypothetical protein
VRRASGPLNDTMDEPTPTTRFVFPRWANYMLPVLVVSAVGGALYMPVLAQLGVSPRTLDAGYAPVQPVQFSHAQHAGQLGIDCRYCHIGVDKGPNSTLPATQICMNCHASVKTDSPKLAAVFESWKTGKPVPWVRVHDLPDYAYFNHSAHVNRGVSCVECHGRVDQMDVVHQVQPLSMGWCLECHRAPEKKLRPLDQITNLGWKPPTQKNDANQLASFLKDEYHIRDPQYMTSCSTCHR